MKALFIARDAPWPLSTGVRQRQFHILQGLAQAAEVDLLVLPPQAAAMPPEVAALCKRAIVQEHAVDGRSRSWTGKVGQLWRELRGSPLDFAPLDHGRLTHAAADALAGGYDVVWIERLQTALSLRHGGGRNVVLDFDDVEHRKLFTARRDLGLRGLRYLRATVEYRAWASAEREALRRFGRVLVCSDDDRRYLASGNVAVVPNGVTMPDRPFTAGVSGRMLFVGLMRYAVNDQAMRWFITDVLPLIRRKRSDAHVWIAGSGASDELKAMDDGAAVRVLGFVPDLGPLMDEAAISVAPLRVSSGTTIKVLESLAARVPVVTTPQGNIGLDLRHGEHLLIADGAQAFAEACTAMLDNEDLRRRLAEKGCAHVRQQYAWSVIQQRVMEIADEAAQARA